MKQGSVEEWYLFNATPTDHTFHIHQMAFAAGEEAPAYQCHMLFHEDNGMMGVIRVI